MVSAGFDGDFARLNLIYVYENLIVAEVGAKVVEQATGVTAAVIAAVADEDA